MLPDLRSRSAQDGSSKLARAFGWQKGLHNLLARHGSAAEIRTLKKAQRAEQVERLATLHAMQAFDHALQFAGSGLQAFLPEERRSCRPLRVHEKRYKVEL